MRPLSAYGTSMSAVKVPSRLAQSVVLGVLLALSPAMMVISSCIGAHVANMGAVYADPGNGHGDNSGRDNQSKRSNDRKDSADSPGRSGDRDNNRPSRSDGASGTGAGGDRDRTAKENDPPGQSEQGNVMSAAPTPDAASTARTNFPFRLFDRGQDLRIQYSNGWDERIRGGRYRLLDPSGQIVTDRPATGQDRERMRAIADQY